jgi:hypothetical protein
MCGDGANWSPVLDMVQGLVRRVTWDVSLRKARLCGSVCGHRARAKSAAVVEVRGRREKERRDETSSERK